MKNWTRTSLIFLAFSIGACESQAPTAPTSSLTPSGALATGAQGQVTSLTAVGAGDIQQAKGGKPGPPGGKDNDKVTYSVEAVAPGCADGNAWVLPNNGESEGLFARWPDDLTVTTVAPGGGVSLTGRASANVVLGKRPFDWVALYLDTNIGQPDRVRYNTDALPISIVGGLSSNVFTIVVDAPFANLYPLTARGNKQGPSVGTICVGDLVYTQQPS